MLLSCKFIQGLHIAIPREARDSNEYFFTAGVDLRLDLASDTGDMAGHAPSPMGKERN